MMMQTAQHACRPVAERTQTPPLVDESKHDSAAAAPAHFGVAGRFGRGSLLSSVCMLLSACVCVCVYALVSLHRASTFPHFLLLLFRTLAAAGRCCEHLGPFEAISTHVRKAWHGMDAGCMLTAGPWATPSALRRLRASLGCLTYVCGSYVCHARAAGQHAPAILFLSLTKRENPLWFVSSMPCSAVLVRPDGPALNRHCCRCAVAAGAALAPLISQPPWPQRRNIQLALLAALPRRIITCTCRPPPLEPPALLRAALPCAVRSAAQRPLLSVRCSGRCPLCPSLPVRPLDSPCE